MKRAVSSIIAILLITIISSCEASENESYHAPNIYVYRDSLIIAHWNIGHFANGKNNDTAITSENYSEMRSQYISVIDSLNADIFGVCEYNPNFDQDGNSTRDAIFYQYNYASIGPKYSYNCNAIFSKDIPLENGGKTYFSRHKQNRYIQSAEIRVN